MITAATAVGVRTGSFQQAAPESSICTSLEIDQPMAPIKTDSAVLSSTVAIMMPDAWTMIYRPARHLGFPVQQALHRQRDIRPHRPGRPGRVGDQLVARSPPDLQGTLGTGPTSAPTAPSPAAECCSARTTPPAALPASHLRWARPDEPGHLLPRGRVPPCSRDTRHARLPGHGHQPSQPRGRLT